MCVHHAGVRLAGRLAGERLLRGGNIRGAVATSTLATGVNLGVETVVVFGGKRGGKGYAWWEVRQMAGRTGRVGQRGGEVYLAGEGEEVGEMAGRLAGKGEEGEFPRGMVEWMRGMVEMVGVGVERVPAGVVGLVRGMGRERGWVRVREREEGWEVAGEGVGRSVVELLAGGELVMVGDDRDRDDRDDMDIGDRDDRDIDRDIDRDGHRDDRNIDRDDKDIDDKDGGEKESVWREDSRDTHGPHDRHYAHNTPLNPHDSIHDPHKDPQHDDTHDDPINQSNDPHTQHDDPINQSNDPHDDQHDDPINQSNDPHTQHDDPTNQSNDPHTQHDDPTNQSNDPHTQHDDPTNHHTNPHTPHVSLAATELGLAVLRSGLPVAEVRALVAALRRLNDSLDVSQTLQVIFHLTPLTALSVPLPRALEYLETYLSEPELRFVDERLLPLATLYRLRSGGRCDVGIGAI